RTFATGAYSDLPSFPTRRSSDLIFDSTLANIGLLYAKAENVFRAYNDTVFTRFWARELDIEDRGAIATILRNVGADVAGSWRSRDRKSTRLNSSHQINSYAVFCL